MKTINIFHLGLGNIGSKVVEIIFSQKNKIKKQLGVELRYVGMFSSQGGVYDPDGLDLAAKDVLRTKQAGDNLKEAMNQFDESSVLIDTTASEKTVPIVQQALEQGGYAVLSNKKPLSSTYEVYRNLQKAGGTRLYAETTVGAGLPVISTLQELILTGDTITQIQGCFSGTLGYICSQLEEGVPYSKAIKTAMELGYTEPDPRDDLSGEDVARKALILARLTGLHLEMTDVKSAPMFHKKFENSSLDAFLKEAPSEDQKYRDMFVHSLSNHNTLRFTATIRNKKIEVGLTEGDKSTPIGSLSGPDNIIVYQTKRYTENPLVIQGPGAGIDVTAAGVVGDVIKIIKN
jgi:homoserine dehydrogenase